MRKERRYTLHGGPFAGPWGPIPAHDQSPHIPCREYKVRRLGETVEHIYRLRDGSDSDMDYVGERPWSDAEIERNAAKLITERAEMAESV